MALLTVAKDAPLRYRVAEAAGPSNGQKLYTDDTLPGFAVRVSQGGTKRFLAIVGNERSFLTIGQHPVIGLTTARDRTRTILAEHQLGIAHKMSPTFAEVRRN